MSKDVFVISMIVFFIPIIIGLVFMAFEESRKDNETKGCGD